MGHARPSLENSSVRNVPSVKTLMERERTKKDKACWAQRGGAGGRVIEQGGLRTLDSGIHKSPQVTTLTMFLYNTSRAECSEAGVRRSGAVHGSRVRDLRVFAQMVPHGARA